MRKNTDSSTTNQGQAEESLSCLPLICGGTIINLTLTQMFHKSYTSNKELKISSEDLALFLVTLSSQC